jgi:membrane fusion protein, multidrug efflux system
VPQSESAQITRGMHASLELPQFPGRQFDATVITTSDAIDPKSNTLLVELMADNQGGALTPGMYAEVRFDLPPRPDVVRIPTSAVLFRQSGLKVALLGNDNKATLVPIKAGRDLGTELEVTAGLTPTDRVIDSPPDSLLPNETVRLAQR